MPIDIHIESHRTGFRTSALSMILPSIKRGIVATVHAGRIRWFIQNWRLITQDQWVLEMVQGFRLPLLQTPVQSKPPPEIHLAADQTALITTARGRRADSQRGNKPSSSGPRRFCLSTFPGPQEGRRVSPGNKPESSEHVHPGGAFQDGELSYDKGTGETPGMASKVGPQGCVLSGPSSPRPPQIPPVPVARPDTPVLLPAIRPVLCSESVHKADETSGGIPEGERNKTNNLFG